MVIKKEYNLEWLYGVLTLKYGHSQIAKCLNSSLGNLDSGKYYCVYVANCT